MTVFVLRLVVVTLLFALCHVAAVHGFAAFLLEDSDVYRFDTFVESVAGAILIAMAARPGRW